MATVYVVLRAFGEGDGHTCFDLLATCFSVDRALDYIVTIHEDHRQCEPIHRSMSKNNNWTYVGDRCDCDTECDYNTFGGYVVEEMDVLGYDD